jgi:hypothetical protein
MRDTVLNKLDEVYRVFIVAGSMAVNNGVRKIVHGYA